MKKLRSRNVKPLAQGYRESRLLPGACNSHLTLFCFFVLFWDQAVSMLWQAGQRRVEPDGHDCVVLHATLLFLCFCASLGLRCSKWVRGIQGAFADVGGWGGLKLPPVLQPSPMPAIIPTLSHRHWLPFPQMLHTHAHTEALGKHLYATSCPLSLRCTPWDHFRLSPLFLWIPQLGTSFPVLLLLSQFRSCTTLGLTLDLTAPNPFSPLLSDKSSQAQTLIPIQSGSTLPVDKVTTP